MEFEDYLNAFKRIDKLLIASYICLAVGAIICFVAIFIPYPAFVYLLCIGFLFILFFLIYMIVRFIKKKYGYRFVKNVKAKPVKIKTVRAKKIKDDKQHVLCKCPSCDKKIRLPNKKGVHGVKCPICKNDFKIKI